MRLLRALAFFVGITQAIDAASNSGTNEAIALHEFKREPDSSKIIARQHILEGRKGGGGGGRGGGGGGGGGSRGGGSSSSSSSRTSSTGGQTRAGSGVSRSYGGGAYYSGGAVVPYEAGKKTPKGLVAGALLLPAAALLLLPGIWYWSVYPYMLPTPYTFYNISAANASANSFTNTTLPVLCLCQQFTVCGCDQNDDTQYIRDLVGNGSYAALNKTLVNVAQYNGNETLIINGTLSNGTTAPGGTSGATIITSPVSKFAGHYAMVMLVLYHVFL